MFDRLVPTPSSALDCLGDAGLLSYLEEMLPGLLDLEIARLQPRPKRLAGILSLIGQGR